jgi:type I restriction enzyme S subunit
MPPWKKVKLGDAAEIIKDTYQPSINDELDYIGLEHIEQQSLRLNSIGKSSSVTSGKFKFQEGDILFGKLRPYFRKVVIPDFSGVCSTDIWVVRARKEYDQKFLFYLLASEPFIEIASSGSTGTRMPRADWTLLKTTEWIFPDLPTQSRIASILSAFDDKIELNRQMNKTLEDIAQALFKESFADSQNGAFQLSECIELNPRNLIPRNSIVKYVEMSDLPISGPSINHYVDRPFNSGSKFQNMDTLLARITPCLENGKTGIVDFMKDDEAGFGSTEFIVMRPKRDISPYYVYFIARDNAFREYAIRSMVGTSGRQRVQTEMLNNFLLADIDINKMNAFHYFSQSCFEKIKENCDENKYLGQIRNSLLPKLMSGEIPVDSLSLIESQKTIVT